tara:strand:- start:5620 stop:5898 length:279 start_codon:yes stop_codon:yes gene_type:complete
MKNTFLLSITLTALYSFGLQAASMEISGKEISHPGAAAKVKHDPEPVSEVGGKSRVRPKPPMTKEELDRFLRTPIDSETIQLAEISAKQKAN